VLQNDIEQRINSYDRVGNTLSTKRQEMLEKTKNLEGAIQNILLASGSMKMKADGVSPFLNEYKKFFPIKPNFEKVNQNCWVMLEIFWTSSNINPKTI